MNYIGWVIQKASFILYDVYMKQSDYISREERYLAHNYKPLPVVLTRGDGTYVYDTDGKQYLDFLSAYSSIIGGHNNKRIKQALIAQLDRLDVPSRAFYTDRLGEFVERLCNVTGMDKALPMNTGAEAVETAIKAARRWGYEKKGIAENQAKIIVSRNNFHGRTTTISGFSSSEESKRSFSPFDGGFVEIPFGDTGALEAAVTDETCAFLTEPMQGEAGIIIPEKGWLKQVQAICRAHNVLLILDEIQTGMGRTGKDFAFQHELETPPDGLTLGKALGGGIYPVSAFLARKDVMDVFVPGSHGSTFGGNPIAAAVGLEALALLQDENLSARSAELGDYMKEQILGLNHSKIREVRGAGLWIGVEFQTAQADAHDVCLALMERGVLAKDTQKTTIRFAPPLTVSKKEIDTALSAIEKVLS